MLLSDTRSNRPSVREYGDVLRGAFPTDGRVALDAMRVGSDPGGNAVVLL